jgi:hypothetical protein
MAEKSPQETPTVVTVHVWRLRILSAACVAWLYMTQVCVCVWVDCSNVAAMQRTAVLALYSSFETIVSTVQKLVNTFRQAIDV